MLAAKITFWTVLALYAIIGAIVTWDNARRNREEPVWWPKPSPLYVGALWLPLAVLETLDRARRPHA